MAPKNRHKTNKDTWDTLREIHSALAQYLRLPAEIAGFLRSRPVLTALQESGRLGEVQEQIELLLRDTTEFGTTLESVRQRHGERQGRLSNGDDRMAAMQYCEVYVEWAAQYERVVLPTLITVAVILRDHAAAAVNNIPQYGDVSGAVRQVMAAAEPQDGV